MNDSVAHTFLLQEARSLLTRLNRVRAFSLTMPMVPAAAISPKALYAIEQSIEAGSAHLRQMIRDFYHWLRQGGVERISTTEAQRRFTILRMRFNNILSQFDIFADVLNQRSEQETGIWLSGLDVVSADALRIEGHYYDAPPVICYLDRGHGAAIRRARTRLPGGARNPVAVIRVPRERMVGSGIASSLIHEVGHQGSALLDLVKSIREILQGLQKTGGDQAIAWSLWDRWISEILADFWSVSRLGIASTLGLIGVVSLPRAFVFRIGADDPHPFPWIRAKLSCAIGNALYPHPQWARLSQLWETLYPAAGLPEEKRQAISSLLSAMPGFVTLLVNHRPKSLRGSSLMEVLRCNKRRPQQLQELYESWRSSPKQMLTEKPSLVFAAIGQARADGRITPEKESSVLTDLLKRWALKSAMDTSELCSRQSSGQTLRGKKLIAV
jgi:hypothetical protein